MRASSSLPSVQEYDIRDPEQFQLFYDATRAAACQKKLEAFWNNVVVLEPCPTRQETIDSMPGQQGMEDDTYMRLCDKRFEKAIAHWDQKMRDAKDHCGEMGAIFYSHLDTNGKQALSKDMEEPDQVERLRLIKHRILTEFAPQGDHVTWRLLQRLNELNDDHGTQHMLDAVVRICNEIRRIEPGKLPEDAHLLALLANGIKTPTFRNYLLITDALTYKKAFQTISQWCTNQPELDVNAKSNVSVHAVVNGEFVPINYTNGHCYQCGQTTHGVRDCKDKGNCNRCGQSGHGVFGCHLGYHGNPYYAHMKAKGTTIPSKRAAWSPEKRAAKAAKTKKTKLVRATAKKLAVAVAVAAKADAAASSSSSEKSSLTASILQAVTAAVSPLTAKLEGMDQRLISKNI